MRILLIRNACKRNLNIPHFNRWRSEVFCGLKPHSKPGYLSIKLKTSSMSVLLSGIESILCEFHITVEGVAQSSFARCCSHKYTPSFYTSWSDCYLCSKWLGICITVSINRIVLVPQVFHVQIPFMQKPLDMGTCHCGSSSTWSKMRVHRVFNMIRLYREYYSTYNDMSFGCRER